MNNNKKCPHCGSHNIDYYTRIVGYFSKLANWNKSKIEEQKKREQGKYNITEPKS